MKPNLKYLYLLLFFLSTFDVSGQIPFFTSHSLSNKLPKQQVNKVLEKRNGFLVFGTTKGLYEYDGQKFDPFLFNDTIATFHVTSLFEDRNQTTWIGTKTGDIFFYYKSKSLKKWEIEEGLPEVRITGFSETNDSTFWFSTYGEGLYYYRNKRLYNIDSEDGLLDNEIYASALYNGNQILVATDSGISICEIEENKKKIQNFTIDDGLSDEIVKTILPDGNGNYYVGTYENGVDYWNGISQTFESLIPTWKFGEINELEIFQNKELWIGTNGNGLFRYDLKTHELNPISIPRFDKSKIFDMHRDVEGNLWVLNNTFGISSANRQFERADHSLSNIQAVLIDRKNKAWLGTANGLFVLNESGGVNINYQHVHIVGEINVISLYEDEWGYVWIGTFGNGLYCLDPVNNKIRQFSVDDGLENGNILSIAGSEGRIWLASLGGVFEMKTHENIFDESYVKFKNYTHEDGLGTDFIYKVFVDKRNRTWFGTDGKGISVLDNEAITNYSDANGFPLKAVYSITEDNQGHIWFSTAEHGIFEFDGKEFEQLDVKEGLSEIEITGLVADDNGNILIIHPTGIDLLNPESKHLIYYDEEIGFKDLDPTLNAMSKDQFGNIYIGAKNQLIRYSHIEENLEIHPRNQIRNVSVLYESIDFENTKSFKSHQNSLNFNYVGLWYTNPNKVEYRYKLEGYNQNWIRSKDLQAHYSDLKPGNYSFKVSSTENSAFDGEPTASFDFKIIAPIWQQPWFLFVMFIFLGGIIYLYLKWKSKSIQREATIQKEKIQSQLDVLKSQINPHFLFNSFNTLISLIEDEPSVATEYVENLSDFYRNILQYRKMDLIPLQEELELLRNFSFLLKMRFGENIHLEIPEINGRLAFIPPLTLQMLVENAIKHNVISKQNSLYIKIGIELDEIYVSNNLQRKFGDKNSTQFGLQSIQTRFALLGGKKIKVDETNKEFRVTMPIIEAV